MGKSKYCGSPQPREQKTTSINGPNTGRGKLNQMPVRIPKVYALAVQLPRALLFRWYPVFAPGRLPKCPSPLQAPRTDMELTIHHRAAIEQCARVPFPTEPPPCRDHSFSEIGSEFCPRPKEMLFGPVSHVSTHGCGRPPRRKQWSSKYSPDRAVWHMIAFEASHVLDERS
jgi:hypothetical protein